MSSRLQRIAQCLMWVPVVLCACAALMFVLILSLRGERALAGLMVWTVFYVAAWASALLVGGPAALWSLLLERRAAALPVQSTPRLLVGVSLLSPLLIVALSSVVGAFSFVLSGTPS